MMFLVCLSRRWVTTCRLKSKGSNDECMECGIHSGLLTTDCWNEIKVGNKLFVALWYKNASSDCKVSEK